MLTVVGEVAGSRELEEPVGTGGMSSVFKARDRLLERDVALKILHEPTSWTPTTSSASGARRARSRSSRT